MHDAQPDTPARPASPTRQAAAPRRALPRPRAAEDCFEALKRLTAEMEDRPARLSRLER